MIIYTSICSNYIHKARTLADSIHQHIPDAKFIVCLVEREKNQEILGTTFDDVVLAKDIWPSNFEHFIFKHSIVEASTSVKGEFLKYLMKEYQEEDEFVYLDPDCFVYSDFVELKEELKTSSIVLCPHLLNPGNVDMELSSTAHGVYNLGFLAVNRSEEAKKFVEWWASRLGMFCYDDIQKGIFTDQKWVDLAPCFFEVKVFKHHGYDFAPWSLLGSEIEKEENAILVNGDPLRFIHFSGYGATAQKCMKDWLPSTDHLFYEIYKQYSVLHENNNLDKVSKTMWSYSMYENGEQIKDSTRIQYRNNYYAFEDAFNPFGYDDKKLLRLIYGKTDLKHILFLNYDYLKRNGLKKYLRHIKTYLTKA